MRELTGVEFVAMQLVRNEDGLACTGSPFPFPEPLQQTLTALVLRGALVESRCRSCGDTHVDTTPTGRSAMVIHQAVDAMLRFA